MAESNRNALAQPGIKVEHDSHDGTIVYTGTREHLLAAGVLREEWMPVKRSKNGNVKTALPDGRQIRVYKKGERLQVWHELPEREAQAFRERAAQAREAIHQRNDVVTRMYPPDSAARLARALERRYPGISVTRCEYQVIHSGTFEQRVDFCGTIERMLEVGLLTPHMVEASQGLSQASKGDALGERWWVARSEDKAEPGVIVLHRYTPDAPAERESFAVRDAQRELKRIFKRSAQQAQ